MAMFSKLGRYSNFALLVMRAGIGAMMVLHGYPKLLDGPERWAKLGGAMENFGITYAPEFWGFMAAFAETFGGLFLALGIFWIPANLLLISTMAVAAMHHIANGDGFGGYAHPVESAILFLSLIFIVPGKYRLISK